MEDFIAGLLEKFPVAGTVIAGLLAAHALATFIVNLTPTPKDDAIVKVVYKGIEWLAGIVSKRAKDGD